MKRLHVVCVCGYGTGTSLILKMSVEDVLSNAGIDADVEFMDVTSALGLRCDLILSNTELFEQLERGNADVKVIPVTDFLDKEIIAKEVVPTARELAEA